jgi:hypothetical protein
VRRAVFRDDPNACPACGRPNDAATSVYVPEESAPEAGDYSICWGCGALAIFTGRGLELRNPTDAEAAEGLANPFVRSARRLWREQMGPVRDL